MKTKIIFLLGLMSFSFAQAADPVQDSLIYCTNKLGATFAITENYLHSGFSYRSSTGGIAGHLESGLSEVSTSRSGKTCKINVTDSANENADKIHLTFYFDTDEGLSSFKKDMTGMKKIIGNDPETVDLYTPNCVVGKRFQDAVKNCQAPKEDQPIVAISCAANADPQTRTEILTDSKYDHFSRKVIDGNVVLEERAVSLRSRSNDGCHVTLTEPDPIKNGRDFEMRVPVTKDLKVSARVERSTIIRSDKEILAVPPEDKNVTCQVKKELSAKLQNCDFQAPYDEDHSTSETTGPASPQRGGTR